MVPHRRRGSPSVRARPPSPLARALASSLELIPGLEELPGAGGVAAILESAIAVPDEAGAGGQCRRLRPRGLLGLAPSGGGEAAGFLRPPPAVPLEPARGPPHRAG